MKQKGILILPNISSLFLLWCAFLLIIFCNCIEYMSPIYYLLPLIMLFYVLALYSSITAKTWPSKFGGRIPASKITMVIGYSTLIMFLLSFSSFLNFNVLAVISNICIFFSAMIPILISHRNKNLFVEEIKKIPSTNRDRRYYKKDLNALSKLIKLLSFRCEEVTLNELISSSRIDLNVEELKDIINDLIQKRVIKGAIESDRLIFFK